LLLGVLGAMIMVPLPSESDAAEADFAGERQRMVEEIRRMAAETGRDTGHPEFADSVLEALRRVPRHRFVPPGQAHSAYRNHPLPIGGGQTISQPYIVALTTHLIAPQKHHRVLEIGTGSGYQAAVLSELVEHVYSVEIVEALGREAEERLQRLGYRNVSVRIGDGHAGWPEHAPYDGIVVTAAATHLPQALVAQLKPGGRMVIPIGEQHTTQRFTLIEKAPDGSLSQRVVLPVLFVPMTGGSARPTPGGP
jgi:protein-L-isoaspartate(D-aspartate) O-methyltransferase